MSFHNEIIFFTIIHTTILKKFERKDLNGEFKNYSFNYSGIILFLIAFRKFLLRLNTCKYISVGTIEVKSEKIDGCNRDTRFCQLKRGVTIKTKLSVKGQLFITVKKQTISLKNEETGEKFTSTTFFCGVPGKPKCHFLTEVFEDRHSHFSLQQGFFTESGILELKLFSKGDYEIYTSAYTFV
ncbi:hypothetical protein MXB_655 [Myxobolus squamalis]|nr:hypothetical protein MXB_655 [Myxobolus squamalis]